MSAHAPLKVLVAGDVEGHFDELFSRVTTVNNKNGPFHMLLCVGNFYGSSSDESTPVHVPSAPIPTYVLGPNSAQQLHNYPDLTGSEISHNVTYLGKTGIYTESSGLRIAYLSGVQSSKSPNKYEFSSDDIHNLHIRSQSESQYPGVDILLTSQWPTGITRHSTAVPEIIKETSSSASNLISQLVILLKPRYHFSGLEGVHFERAPYRNHKVLAESVQHTTRFIALAKVGNKGKKKWLYAFSIVPMKHLPHSELIKAPADTTECPYSADLFQQASSNASSDKTQAQQQQFFYDMAMQDPSDRKNKRKGHGGHGQSHPPKQPYQPKSCWFCLASPEVEKHLVVSIGEVSYLTLAKGGLTPDHVLILPIGHFQSLIECPEEVILEIQKFKSALKKMFLSHNQGVVFYERNFKSPHLQIQVVPVPISIIESLKSTCLDFAESNEIELQVMPSNAQLFQMTKIGFPYFYMELPDGTKLFYGINIKKGKHFDLQFGRELLASEPVLNLPDKVDWKLCKSSKEEEIEITGKFRKLFEPFDFTL